MILRFPRPALLTVALATLAGLALIGSWHHPTTDAPGEPLVCMDGWGVAEMVRHLEARGLGLCALPTSKDGPLVRNVFLAVPGKTFEDLAGLLMDPASIDRWNGAVYCEECPRFEARDLEGLWGDCALRAGPFVFFGDRDLLARIQEALRDVPPDGRWPARSHSGS
jgi:hypothetical protein